MAHFCREEFSSLLEKDEVLFSLLTKHFYPSKSLYEDLEDHNLLPGFSNFIYSRLEEPKEEVKTTKTPFELMEEAGYNLYECKTEEEIQAFKKYYEDDEALCTFHGGRLNKSYVFFAVKKNVDDIKRSENPERQDEYGTSVISIQFRKGSLNFISIKNRYNHTVSNPDATFSNNLDNIIPGLTHSFRTYYGFNLSPNNTDFEIPGYVMAANEKYYKANYEINNIYYCTNNIVIKNFEARRYNPSKYLLMDSYLLDLERKRIDPFVSSDGILEALGEIYTIEIEKYQDAKVITITSSTGRTEIVMDTDNCIVEFTNKTLEKLFDCFLQYNEKLYALNTPNVKYIGRYVLQHNYMLEKLCLPNCESIGSDFLHYNICLRTIDLPKCKKIDAGSFDNCFVNEARIPVLNGRSRVRTR